MRALLLIFLAISLFSFNTQPNKWRFVGDKNVAYGVDHDVLHVTSINDHFTKLKFKITDAPLKIMDVKVYFDNGDIFDVSLKSEIKQGGETRVIDLPGGARKLKKIEFWYSTVGSGKGRARIAVWGKR